MECKMCKLNALTMILNILLIASLVANIWLLQRLDSVYYHTNNNSWVTEQELDLIKEEIKRLENSKN